MLNKTKTNAMKKIVIALALAFAAAACTPKATEGANDSTAVSVDTVKVDTVNAQ